MHTWELKKERKGQRDLQKERNSDSWRNTDTEKEKQHKLEADGQRENKPMHEKAGIHAGWTDTQQRWQKERRAYVQGDKTRNREDET